MGDTITIKKENLWRYSTFILAAIVIVGAFVIFSQDRGAPTGNVVANPANPSPGVQERVQLEITEEDYVKGDPEAPVKIFEYSDFECPFCARFYSQTLSALEQQYVDSGKVAFIYRHFPLTSIHTNAQKAAEAAECAGEQGKFWEMHDILFEQGVEGGIISFKSYASQLGLNTNQFNTCLDSGKYAEKVSDQTQNGASIGVQGTPAFLIGTEDNGYVLVSGAQPLQKFQQAIDAEL